MPELDTFSSVNILVGHAEEKPLVRKPVGAYCLRQAKRLVSLKNREEVNAALIFFLVSPQENKVCLVVSF